jgi:hypothetical protein
LKHIHDLVFDLPSQCGELLGMIFFQAGGLIHKNHLTPFFDWTPLLQQPAGQAAVSTPQFCDSDWAIFFVPDPTGVALE